jgi:hypothetical protein
MEKYTFRDLNDHEPCMGIVFMTGSLHFEHIYWSY